MANKVHSIYFADSVLPGTAIGYTYRIANPGRTMKIKSILWDIKFTELPVTKVLPLITNTTQIFSFQIGNANNKISSAFEITGLTPQPQSNGDLILLSTPGQYLFDGFYVSEYLNLFLINTNNDAAKTYFLEFSNIIETEEKIIYT